MATLPVDLELKKAFQEMQIKKIQTSQQLKIADQQVEALKRKIAHSQLVDKEIASLPEETRVYEGVGRMFLLMSIPVVRENLAKKKDQAEDKIKTIETNKEYLEKSLKENEQNLRELVLSKQQQR
ncbi:prefoldin subunit 1-like isoform X2 [Pomacea canaliculata]|uniref:prefoldin subunit 1-like isoform X2 n=1 Tax=Pomacea canaliculata TaxID=400727 RepID=UPI000D73034F|nr:prefoldin subunit 1-like isoform X2 [Pomacea canaliculata]